ncbi:MAG: hypothetical protein M9949_06020 [Candidatus Kapabacteria bacterium]|nr:hypothetical protein [Candidatus Kapabacteria bacterium]
MMNEKQIAVLQQAIQFYGIANQFDMAIEECAELIQALNKVKRSDLIGISEIEKPNSNMKTDSALAYHNLCSEVADVEIMLNQLKILLNKEIIQLSIDRKIERLNQRLNPDSNPGPKMNVFTIPQNLPNTTHSITDTGESNV